MEYLLLLMVAVGVAAYAYNLGKRRQRMKLLLDPTESQKRFLADLCRIPYEAWEKDSHCEIRFGEKVWVIRFGADSALIMPDGTYPLDRAVVSALIDMLKTARDNGDLAPIELNDDKPRGGSA